MIRSTAFAVLVSAALAWPAPPPADATFPGRPGRIAYVSAKPVDPGEDHSGIHDVYTRRLDGSGVRRLTFSRRYTDRDPSWSPDGRQIVWSCHGEDVDVDPFYVATICVMDADGSDKVRFDFETSVRSPEFSPDGSRIAYVTDGPGTAAHPLDEVFVMDRDGSNRVKVTTNATSETAIAWSPSGDEIAFVTYDRSRGGGDLHVVNVDTGIERLIAANVEARPHYHGLDTAYVDWSPDGAHILFLRTHDDDDSVDLFVIDPQGVTETQLTSEFGEYDVGPSWSPDGTRIIFRHASEAAHPETGTAWPCIVEFPGDGSELEYTHHRRDCGPRKVVELDYAWQPR